MLLSEVLPCLYSVNESQVGVCCRPCHLSLMPSLKVVLIQNNRWEI